MGCMMSRSRSTKNGDGESGEILRGRASDGSVWRASSLAFSAPHGRPWEGTGVEPLIKGQPQSEGLRARASRRAPAQGPAPFLCVVLRLASRRLSEILNTQHHPGMRFRTARHAQGAHPLLAPCLAERPCRSVRTRRGELQGTPSPNVFGNEVALPSLPKTSLRMCCRTVICRRSAAPG